MVVNVWTVEDYFFTPDKVIEIQEICTSNENIQHKNMPQKAIAVVTPLKQQEVVNEQEIEAGSLPKKIHQVTQLKDVACGLTSKNEIQTDVPKELSKTAFASGDSQQVESEKHANTKYFSGNSLITLSNTMQTDIPQALQSKSITVPQNAEGKTLSKNEELSSNTLKSIVDAKRTESHHRFQSIMAGEVFKHIEFSSKTEELSTPMDKSVPCFSGQGCKLFDEGCALLVTEWSLQRLQDLIFKLEQMQKLHLKNLQISCPTQEILNLYWNGDFQNVCQMSKSRLYANILKEVNLYYGKKDTVILKTVSEENLNRVASEYHILKHDYAPPETMYNSSWLNVTEKPPDIDDDEYPSFIMTSHNKSQVNDELEKVQRNLNKLDKEKTADMKTNTELKQPKPLSPKHKIIPVVKRDKAERTKKVFINNKSGGSIHVTENVEQEGTKLPLVISCNSVENVIMKSLSTEEVPETDDTNVNKLSISKSSKTHLHEIVYTTQRNLVETQMNSNGQDIIELSDQMSKDIMQTDTEMTMEIGNKSLNQVTEQSQIDSYCCIAKWFKVLGYRNRGRCKCEQKAILNNNVVDLEIIEVISDKQEVEKLVNAVFMPKNTLSPVSHQFPENISHYRSDTVKKRKTHQTCCSQREFDKSFHLDTDVSLQLNTNRKEIITPNASTAEKTINLALYGSSYRRGTQSIGYRRKCSSGIGESNTVHHPPETLNIRVSSYGNDNSSTSESKNAEQYAYMPSKKLDVESQTQKCSDIFDLEKDSADTSVTSHKSSAFSQIKALLHQNDKQTHEFRSTNYKRKFPLADKQGHSDQLKERLCLTREDNIRTLKKRGKLASLSFKRQDCLNAQRNPNRLLLKKFTRRPERKRKDDSNLALDFRVLPDSFNLTEFTSSSDADQSASFDCGKHCILASCICYIITF